MTKLKSLIITALLLSTPSFAQEVCGRYEVYDLGNNSHISTLVDYVTYRQQGLTYSIQNPSSANVKSMVNGYCYCVTGVVVNDPSNPGDALYRALTIGSIATGPYFNCR